MGILALRPALVCQPLTHAPPPCSLVERSAAWVEDPAAAEALASSSSSSAGNASKSSSSQPSPVLTLAALQREYAVVRGHRALAAAMPGGQQGHASLAGGGSGRSALAGGLQGGDAENVFAQLLALGERVANKRVWLGLSRPRWGGARLLLHAAGLSLSGWGDARLLLHAAGLSWATLVTPACWGDARMLSHAAEPQLRLPSHLQASTTRRSSWPRPPLWARSSLVRWSACSPRWALPVCVHRWPGGGRLALAKAAQRLQAGTTWRQMKAQRAAQRAQRRRREAAGRTAARRRWLIGAV